MTEFLIANMAPVMFATLVLFLLSGFPVAFSLAANGLLFGLIGIELGLLKPELLKHSLTGYSALWAMTLCSLFPSSLSWA